MIAGTTDAGICLLEFTDRRAIEAQIASVHHRFDGPVVPGVHPLLKRLNKELTAYFERELHSFTVPLCYPGTEFQVRVWSELLRIPYGETRSYADLARSIGTSGAARAVGRANGQNRIAIVIPCHRVVNADGALGGYGGGLRRKEYLLRLESGARESLGL
jgi:AraC family transcriptional regulator of adaptative response/methylated-DNA-[protein]-cysteine methyltransferase